MEISVDEGYADVRLARLYDAECPWHSQDDFYQALDQEAGSVLDVGCGTGTRLVSTRERGHAGVLVGVDPAAGMLAVARGKTDRVEWLEGAAQTLNLERGFDLLTMTGHAFQTLLDDAAVEAALRAFHRHLVPGGLLAFETRNPLARAWDGWVTERTRAEIVAPDGEPFEVWADRPRQHAPDLVTFTSYTRASRTGAEHAADSTLRFIDPPRLRDLVMQCGFEIEHLYGDWDGSEVTPAAPEVIVLARRPADTPIR